MVEVFNGNNHYNNNVVVDFIKNTVVFEPLVTGKFFSYYFIFLFNMIAYIFIWSLAVPYFISVFFISKPELQLYTENAIIFVSLFCSLFTFVYSLNYFRPSWRKNWFPKVMASFSSKKKKNVNPDAIIDNKFIIPCFSNVLLEYEADGDFATNLKKIEVKNLYKNEEYDFFCVFEFLKKPIDGKLTIRYA